MPNSLSIDQVLQQSREIKQQLEHDLNYAITVLKPYFNIPLNTNLRKPIISFDDQVLTGYFFETATFQFDLKDIKNPISVAHEVSHYLHEEINPLRGPLPWVPRWQRVMLQECVAQYGAKIYCSTQNVPIPTYKSGDYPLELVDTDYSYNQYLCHDIGYKRADVLYKRYQQSKLPDVACLSIPESEKVLPQLAPIGFYEKHILPLLAKRIK